jgi:hypothetical protein
VAVTMADVRAALDPEEPDYGQAAQLGVEALPFLLALVEGSDPMLAAKATYAAGFIGAPEAADVVERAAHSKDPGLRVAAAGAISHLPPEQSAHLVGPLLEDDDRGVRRLALASLDRVGATPEMLSRIERLAETDPDPGIRRLAAETTLKYGRPMGAS